MTAARAATRATLVFAIPGDLAERTGGYAYDRRMIAELSALGWQVRHLALSSEFPFPGDAALVHARRAFEELPEGALVLVDGLALGAMPDVAQEQAERLRLAALVHHPLARESGLAADVAATLMASEARALRHCRGVVVTGAATAEDLAAHYGVPNDRIAVVLPGIDAAKRRSRTANVPPLILSLGTLTQRKDHATLVAALARLASRPWRCRIVGSPLRDPETARRLAEAIVRAGLEGRVALVGEVDDVGVELAGADIFALASRHEGYGMAFAEAMAAGLPIVGCAAGAVPDVVPPQAGILVAPGDAPAFAAALGRLLDDDGLRRSLSRGALDAGARLASWPQSATRLSNALEAMAA